MTFSAFVRQQIPPVSAGWTVKNTCVCTCREEGAWRRGGGEETSSWRDSRREDFDRDDRRERRDMRDRRDDCDRDQRGPQRDHDEGQRFMICTKSTSPVRSVTSIPH